MVNMIRVLFQTREFGVLELIVSFLIWIAGMVYCERVADEKGLNEWLARAVGVLLPIIGPGIYWFLRNRKKLRRKWRHLKG
jgi:hypothetical protein